MRFGELFKSLIERRGIAKSALCRQIGVSRPYLYAVLSGEASPPVAEKQAQIANLLGLTNSERAAFFDAAAAERDELPADIAEYYLSSATRRREFRRQRVVDLGSVADGKRDVHGGA